MVAKFDTQYCMKDITCRVCILTKYLKVYFVILSNYSLSKQLFQIDFRKFFVDDPRGPPDVVLLGADGMTALHRSGRTIQSLEPTDFSIQVDPFDWVG